MEVIQVSFAELRSITQQVISFVQDKYWLEQDSTLKTSIEDDLGITGIDAEELLNAFSELFNVDLCNFDFDEYFAYEGKAINNPIDILLTPLAVMAMALLLVAFFAQCLLSLAILPLNKRKAKEVLDFSLTSQWGIYSRRRWPNKNPERTFNIGDLVASAVAKRFVKREQIRFVLT